MRFIKVLDMVVGGDTNNGKKVVGGDTNNGKKCSYTTIIAVVGVSTMSVRLILICHSERSEESTTMAFKGCF